MRPFKKIILSCIILLFLSGFKCLSSDFEAGEYLNKIIFIGELPSNNYIYSVNFDGSDLKIIYPNLVGRGLCISKDRRTIYFTNGSDLYSMDMHGNNVTLIHTFSLIVPQFLSASPDGKKIIASATSTSGDDCYITNTAPGTEETYLFNDDHYCVTYSPCGQKIAYSISGGSNYLCISNPDGTNQKILGTYTSASAIFSIGWHPDCKRLLFSPSSENALYEINIKTLQVRTVYQAGSVIFFGKYSPDGYKIALNIGNYYYTMNADGTNVKKISDLHYGSCPHFLGYPD